MGRNNCAGPFPDLSNYADMSHEEIYKQRLQEIQDKLDRAKVWLSHSGVYVSTLYFKDAAELTADLQKYITENQQLFKK